MPPPPQAPTTVGKMKIKKKKRPRDPLVGLNEEDQLLHLMDEMSAGIKGVRKCGGLGAMGSRRLRSQWVGLIHRSCIN